jgi:hypothetical protein
VPFLDLTIAKYIAGDRGPITPDLYRREGMAVVGKNMEFGPNVIENMAKAFYQTIGDTQISNGALSEIPHKGNPLFFPPGTYIGLGNRMSNGRMSYGHGVTIVGYKTATGETLLWNREGNLVSNSGRVVPLEDIEKLQIKDFVVLNVSTSNRPHKDQVFISTLSRELPRAKSTIATFYLPNAYRVAPGSGQITSHTAYHYRNEQNLAAWP